MEITEKWWIRHGHKYKASYVGSSLKMFELVKDDGSHIPPDTTTFKRLADNNRVRMVKRHIETHPEYSELGVFAGYGEFDCSHIAIVSISETECQCMDCLRTWSKRPDFKSDWPNQDRG